MWNILGTNFAKFAASLVLLTGVGVTTGVIINTNQPDGRTAVNAETAPRNDATSQSAEDTKADPKGVTEKTENTAEAENTINTIDAKKTKKSGKPGTDSNTSGRAKRTNHRNTKSASKTAWVPEEASSTTDEDNDESTVEAEETTTEVEETTTETESTAVSEATSESEVEVEAEADTGINYPSNLTQLIGPNTYPYKNVCPQNNMQLSAFGGVVCQCTSYASWKAYEKWEVINTWGGNAYSYERGAGYYVPKSGIFSYVDSEPAPNTIAIWKNGEYGHVAWVESVNTDGSINVSEYNVNWPAVGCYIGDYCSRTGVSPAGVTFLHFE